MRFRIALKSRQLDRRRIVERIEADDAEGAVLALALYLVKNKKDVTRKVGTDYGVNIRKVGR